MNFDLHFCSHTFHAQVFECPTEESETAIYVNIISKVNTTNPASLGCFAEL